MSSPNHVATAAVSALLRVEAEVVAETSGDQPRPQNVLHGLAQAQVQGEREGGDQIRQPKTRVTVAHLHGQSLSGAAG